MKNKGFGIFPALLFSVLFAVQALSGPSFGAELKWDGSNYSSAREPSVNGYLGQGLFPTDGAGNLVYTNNKVIVDDVGGTSSSFKGNVYGGTNASSDNDAIKTTVAGNIVTISGAISIENNDSPVTPGTPTPWINSGSVIGGFSGLGNTTGNKVDIRLDGGHSVEGNVVGGLSRDTGDVTPHTGTASQNGVTISAEVQGSVYGGMSSEGNTVNNSVAILGGNVVGEIVGGMSDSTLQLPIPTPIIPELSGVAQGNTVSITGGRHTSGKVIGGKSLNNSVIANTVSISGTDTSLGTTDTLIYGGYIVAGDHTDESPGGVVSKNSVVVEDVTLTNNAAVVGGLTGGSGTVSGNTVTVGKNVTIWREHSIESSGVVAGVIGGLSYGKGEVTDNHVVVADSDMQSSVYGGYAMKGDANANSVSMTNAKGVDKIVGGESAEGSVMGNVVNLKDSDASGAVVIGGLAARTDLPGNDALENKVVVSGSQVHEIYGGSSKTGMADGNEVEVTGATVTAGIMGGRTESADAISASGNKVTATNATIQGDVFGGAAVNGGVSNNNVVTLSGGSVDGDVYGGYANAAALSTVNNTVNVGNGIGFAQTSSLHGGTGTDFSGNTLNTDGYGYSLDTIDHFENYTFAVDSDYDGKTVYDTDTKVDMAGAKVTTYATGKNKPLEPGQKVTLFSDTDNVDLANDVFDFGKGVVFEHDGKYLTETDGSGKTALVIEVTSTKTTPETNVFGQGQLGGLQLVNSAGDFAHSISDLYGAAAKDVCDPCRPIYAGPVAFVGVSGGASKWGAGAGTHLRMRHTSVLAGAGIRRGGLLLAGFFEGGWGRYDASVSGANIIDGEKTGYLGGGALVRYEADAFYAEASGHLGRNSIDFNADFTDAGYRHEYRDKSMYFGASALLGYRARLGCSLVDFSAGYSWSRLNGDDFVVDDTPVSTGAANSHRLRAGGRWRYEGAGYVKPYAGAYYEYEFDAKSSHDAHGYALSQAKLSGSTGIGELGVRLGREDKRFSADIGVEGYVGKRKGFAAKAAFGWTF